MFDQIYDPTQVFSLLKTREDEGIIRVPQLSPHLQFTLWNDKSHAGGKGKAVVHAFFSSEFSDAVLSGELVGKVLKLIDGSNDRYRIAEALSETAPAMEVNALLSRMAYSFYIVSAEHGLPQDQVAMWGAIGVSPRYAESKLGACRVAVVCGNGRDGQAQQLREMLASWQLQLSDAEADADFLIMLTDDYLDNSLREFNQSRLEDKRPWMLVRTVGLQPLVGPVFTPADNGACWGCLYHRMKANREVRSFLGFQQDGEELLVPKFLDRRALEGALALAALEAAKWVVLRDEAPERAVLSTRLLSFNLALVDYASHVVMKRPQCISCGDEALYKTDREPRPVVFCEGGELVFTSGGMKAREPYSTLEKYKDLVSPLSGVVTQLLRSSPANDDWLHVYWAGSNLALWNYSYKMLTGSLRTKSSGKGRSRDQAKASAMCEAIERYSGVFHGDEIRKTARFSDFAEGEAMRPNEVMLYSRKQYAQREEINARGHRFHHVPLEFDEDAGMEWSPVWSVTRERHVWMLVQQLYFSYPTRMEKLYSGPDSNGAASGNTLEEAMVQGFMELVERDAFAVWWYNRLQYPEFDLDSLGDSFLSKARPLYRQRYNRDLWVLDITHDLGIPVMVAISRRIDKEKQDICFSAGAHFDPHIACLRAVCELNQYLSAVLEATDEDDSYSYMDPECLDWWTKTKLENEPWLRPDPAAAIRSARDYDPPGRTIYGDCRACIDLVHDMGLELLVLDQTRPDVGLPVIKLLVPGIRHFWARFAPGRLFDVPVAMGRLDAPKREDDLNPVPVFI